MRTRHVGLLVLAAAGITHLGCADKSPLAPSAAPPLAGAASSGSLRALNAPPNLVVRTTPPADYSTNPPTIRVTTAAPLNVFFGLCQSSDADAGDSLNWQFNFGDSGRPAFNADGTFNPDHEHECRAEHEYREGTWTATVSVTDKHLEDQSRGVKLLARQTQKFTIVAAIARGGDCERGVSVNTAFEGFAPGTLAETLGVSGVSFSAAGSADILFLPPGALPPLANNTLQGGFVPLDMTFQTDQESYRFDVVAFTPPIIVNGFDAGGAPVFTHTFTTAPLIPITASGSGRFRRLVLTAPPFNLYLMDNLSTDPSCK